MEDEDLQEYGGPSKSQRKRQAHALQDLGGELVRLSRDRLEKLELPEALKAAVLEAKRITSHGAIRRQMQWIGKLMREVDGDAIARQLAKIRGESDAAKAAFHALEQWRDRLLQEDEAVTRWLAHYPDTDAQRLRQLIRNARREAAESKPPKSSRALFRLLRDVAEAKTG
jgi:ribosome-associated protein